MYQPKRIGDPVSAEVELLLMRLNDRRVTMLIGAGVSHGAPTNLPLAEQLAGLLWGKFRRSFARAALEQIANDDRKDLLAVADAIADADPTGLQVLQRSLTEVGFGTAPPNYGHRALALLSAEGLIPITLSINYDTCVERAAEQIGVGIHACRDADELQLGGGKGRLVKLHGCVSRERTMLVTRQQLEAASDWALANVMSAVANNAVVVVGIGSLARYLRATLEKVWQYARRAESVWIASPTVDLSWDTLLGEANEAHKIREVADEFFDELLRACVRRELNELTSLAERLDESIQMSGLTLGEAVGQLVDLIDQADPETVMLYLRRGGLPHGATAPLATGDKAQRSLLALVVRQS